MGSTGHPGAPHAGPVLGASSKCAERTGQLLPITKVQCPKGPVTQNNGLPFIPEFRERGPPAEGWVGEGGVGSRQGHWEDRRINY